MVNDLTTFSALPLTLDSFVWIILGVLLCIYIIFSAVLYYHWQTYTSDKKVTRLTYITYTITTLPLVLVLLISSIIIT